MKFIEVLPIGSPVTISTDICGTITSIWIEDNNHVSYKVSWWSGRDHKSEFFPAFEVLEDDTEKQKIGFKG